MVSMDVARIALMENDENRLLTQGIWKRSDCQIKIMVARHQHRDLVWSSLVFRKKRH
jgi:hypothetical protein